MMVTTAALARILFDTRDRVWPLIVMPALLAALVLTFTRSAWVGASVAVAALLLLKDFRLIGALPVVVAIAIAVAPPQVTERFYSMFDLKDPTSRDRVAMLREGVRMIEADPLTGMGPNMVERQYIRFRDTDSVERVNPHLHNVPMQIAAERGLPALGRLAVVRRRRGRGHLAAAAARPRARAGRRRARRHRRHARRRACSSTTSATRCS